MEVLATTPFGQRPMSAILVQRAQEAEAPVQVSHIDKWALFRDLCAARAAFEVTDRDLTVLNALLSFHPSKTLSDNDNLVVFPSNLALSERAHGMAESTLRRHLAALSHAGLIQRRDSPNGKRYAARGQGGEMVRAFGFDLRPLLVRAGDIARNASEARAAADRLKRLREEVMVLRRDAIKLCQYAGDMGLQGEWTTIEQDLLQIHKRSRRKATFEQLIDLRSELTTLLARQRMLLKSTKMDGSDLKTERHHHSSNKDLSESDNSKEKIKQDGPSGSQTTEPLLPLALVLRACPDIEPYASNAIRSWSDLIDVAGFVRSMMGISESAWREAINTMGAADAAMVVTGILQRIDDIQSPGGYLRALSRKAEEGTFSPGPMIMSLLSKS